MMPICEIFNLDERIKSMPLPKLKIRDLEANFPVIQAGMGIGIGNASLAAATIKSGGFGVISTVGNGVQEEALHDYIAYANQQVAREIQKARSLGAKSNLGVNIMVATSNYDELVKTAVDEKIDFIVSGAGLPLKLPALVGDADIGLIPVISGGRALNVVMKSWVNRYKRRPDAIIVEGPRCGGHLGFYPEELAAPEKRSLLILFSEIKGVLASYGCESVPVLAAGEVASKHDIEAMLDIGYNGVQIGTKFITTEESGIDRKSKEYFINATNDDVVIISSPVGLPVRVLRSPLVERILSGEREHFICKFHCLRPCNPQAVSFCIAKALLHTVEGDVKNGLFMVGCNVSSMKDIKPVSIFFKSLIGPQEELDEK